MDKIFPEINHSMNVIFQENPQPMWVFDIATLNFLTVNNAALQHYGYTEEEFLSMSVRDIRPKEDIEKLEQTIENLSGPATTRRTFRHLKKDGSIIYVDIISFPLPYNNGQSRLVMISDITESTLLLERFDLISKATHDAVWDWNLETDELWWNKSFIDVFGHSGQELKNDLESWANRIHPEDKDQVLASISEAIQGGQKNWTKHYRFLKGDGTYADVIDRGYTQFKDGKGIRMVGSMMDITLQLQLERARAQSDSILQTISSASPTALWMSDVEGNLVYINQKWLTWSNTSLADNQMNGWLKIVHPDDVTLVSETYAKSVLERTAYELDYRIILKDGEERWVLATGFPRYEQDNTFTGFVGAVTDITRQKHMEIQKDTFINTISHELKTPISTIKGFGQLLRKSKTIVESPVVKHLDRILVQADRMDRLIQDLLDVSRIALGKLVLNEMEVDFKKLLSDSIQDLQLVYPTHKLELTENADCKLYGDPARMTQLITNLIDNAVKYSPAANRVLIYQHCDKEFLTVSVQDFGLGIIKSNLPFIFDKFYQVNDVYKTPGLGIGLYVCKEIIERMNGSIWLNSTEGEGSIFSFKLPRKL